MSTPGTVAVYSCDDLIDRTRMQRVDVLCRASPDPIPAIRDGDIVVWDFERQVATETDPDRVWTERSFLLLDRGIQLKKPHWWLDQDPGTWYVDLVKIEESGTLITVRDLYIDAIVPTDGRPYRMLDVHEFGDALESGALGLNDAIDGLRRWQNFLDTFLQIRGWMTTETFWKDFPPACIRELASLNIATLVGKN